MRPIPETIRFGVAGFLFLVTVSDGLLVAVADESAKTGATAPKAVEPVRPVVKVVEGGESKTPPEDCLATLVGPGINQPDAYPGYGGFVGWNAPVRLKNGDWLIGFSSGYWHASPPTPLRYSLKTLEQYRKMGMPPEVNAPTGGRAMLIRSSDAGKSWSKPVTLLDTPDDDRQPALLELPDGTLLCSLFIYPGVEIPDLAAHPEDAHRTVIIRSHDHGHSWDKELIKPPSPFIADETDGPMVLLSDGSVLLTISGAPKGGGPPQAAVFTSTDSGASWQLRSVVKTDHELEEANAVELPDGTLVLMGRREGDICWSADQGRTWTTPVTFGMRIFAPNLYVLRDGTLVCLHGSYAAGSVHNRLCVVFSTDGGHTWIAPAADHGFLVSNCYGYGKAMELPDGSLFVTEQDTAGVTTADASNMSMRCLRLRIREDKSGIELMPAPNR
jgi:photosystem II stability/assembly factor-like uncharacterized protein